MEPVVSVLVVTCNNESTVAAALESVFAQEASFSFDVVVSDNGSTDGTGRVIDEFAARYPDRLLVLRQEKKLQDGGAESVLLGLEACGGRYIATLDGAARWTESDKLQHQANLLHGQPQYSMCFHNCNVEYEEKDCKPRQLVHRFLPESVATEYLLKGAMTQTSTIMMRREMVSNVREWPALLTQADWFIGLVASRSGPVGYIDRVMSAYRQSASGDLQSSNRGDQWAAVARFYEQVAEVLGEEHRDSVDRARRECSYLAATEYERACDFANAKAFLLRSLVARGTSGEVLRAATKRLRLYDFPLLCRLWFGFDRFRAGARWRRLDAAMQLRSHLRLERREPLGFIIASPNPAPVTARKPSLSWVTLEWASAATEVVEVRLGKPDGQLIARGGAFGKVQTDEWVRDGTVFYLQNLVGEFGDLALTEENTLDVVRVTVK